MVFQGCLKSDRSLKEVSRMFEGSFKGVYKKCQGCFQEVQKVFQGSFKEISRKFHGCLNQDWRAFQVVLDSFKGVSS